MKNNNGIYYHNYNHDNNLCFTRFILVGSIYTEITWVKITDNFRLWMSRSMINHSFIAYM